MHHAGPTAMYSVNCQCGKDIRVELFQAGTSVVCPACQKTIGVPGMTRLKELAGDADPHLSPMDKVLARLERRESPFDGPCQRCGDYPALIEIPVEFKSTVERDLEDEGGVGLFLHYAVLRMGKGTTYGTIVRFPLLLCETCAKKFEAATKWSAIARPFVIIGLFAVVFGAASLMTLVLMSVFSLKTSIGISSGVTLIVVGRIMYSRGSKQGNHSLKVWLEKVPWVSEAIAAEDEYLLTFEHPRGWNRPPLTSSEAKETL